MLINIWWWIYDGEYDDEYDGEYGDEYMVNMWIYGEYGDEYDGEYVTWIWWIYGEHIYYIYNHIYIYALYNIWWIYDEYMVNMWWI